MKKNFLVSLALVGGLAITGFATTAYAGNISDTSYQFYISTSGSVAHTTARPKYDATSAYMKFGWIQDGAGAYRVKVVDSNGYDFTKFWWSQYFNDYTPTGTQAWISNYAYEDRGYGVNVKLKAEGQGGAVSGGIWSTGGVWSPDSVR